MARFKDRREAGQLLAQKLSNYANDRNLIVVALPRGGVPVGFEVAKALNAPLDILVVRKLGMPNDSRYGLMITGRRENPNELNRDEREQDQQVDSQSPKCEPHSPSHFDPWHDLFSTC